jgi:hypothetical protein
MATALVGSDAVGRAPSDGARVGVTVGLAESFVSSGLTVAGARLPDAVGLGVGVEVAGGLDDGLVDGLTVGVGALTCGEGATFGAFCDPDCQANAT